MIESICEKCGCIFTQTGKDSSGKKYIKRFCSRTCANSHVRTDESKNKVRESIKNSEKVKLDQFTRKLKHASNRLTKICKNCGCEFKVNPSNFNRTYCSRKCVDTDPNKNKIYRTPMGGYREGSGRSNSGHYKGYFCNSTYELVFVIWNLDNNIDIKRCDNIFDYTYNGKNHKYHPDFVIGDVIYEIKGFHTDIVDVKTKCVEDSGFDIKVLYKNDLKHCFDYVKQTYQYKCLEELYDDSNMKTYACSYCQKEFIRAKRVKTPKVFCSRKCSGLHLKYGYLNDLS